MSKDSLKKIEKEVIACRLCPRLVEWRERAAREKVKRFKEEAYWGKPVPGFGDARARLVIIGLAPAAHGANRTGRMFTGDRSGDWLYRALHRAGFASQPESVEASDGLRLIDCWITAAVRCAPPKNKPTRQEMDACRPFLLGELEALKRRKVLLGLGKIGFDAAFDSASELGWTDLSARPKFSHRAEVELTDGLSLLGSYHPSQQNTFTGKLTEQMLDGVVCRARQLLG